MDFLQIDGAQGEGGGQILRLAATFSVIKSMPVRVSNIRAGREVPGLKRQHAAALHVLADAFDADLRGAVEGSSEVSFAPGRIDAKSLSVDMKTAASITLVLQAVVPAASISGAGVDLELIGGTDVPWSPTLDYFDLVAKPAYSAIGIKFDCVSTRRGYYPKGGGVVRTKVEPGGKIEPLHLEGTVVAREAAVISRCANLPRGVAERQLESAKASLEELGTLIGSSVVSEETALSPGSSILVCSIGGGQYLGSDSIGSRGKRAEEVGLQAAKGYLQGVQTRAGLDANLADMVCPLLSLAPRPSSLRVPRITSHLATGMLIAKQFTGCTYSWTEDGGGYIVRIDPKATNP